MKQILTIIIALITLTASAQLQDGYISTSYLGWEDGAYKVKVTNKQQCQADIQFDYTNLNNVTVSPNPKNNIYYNQIAPGATVVYSIKAAYVQNFKIGVKALSICSWQGTNPVFLFHSLQYLPIKMSDIAGKILADGRYEIRFTVYEQTNVASINVQASTDGKEFRTVTIFLPTDVPLNTQLVARIKL